MRNILKITNVVQLLKTEFYNTCPKEQIVLLARKLLVCSICKYAQFTPAKVSKSTTVHIQEHFLGKHKKKGRSTNLSKKEERKAPALIKNHAIKINLE